MTDELTRTFDELEALLGYRFKDRELLRRALTHSSYANESGDPEVLHNERLEYLGDSVLDMVIAEILFRRFPEAREGPLTKRRAQLVSRRALAPIALKLSLDEFLLLGRGERSIGGARNRSILADTVEALIAAIYLDGGIRQARAFIRRHWKAQLKQPIDAPEAIDELSLLQQYSQSHFKTLPTYHLVEEEGPAHRKSFRYEVRISGQEVGSGGSFTKKEARRAAAREALRFLEVIPAVDDEDSDL